MFADVTPTMRIFREEIFGPVVCVTPFDDEDEAIALANDTRYGLAAYVWTSDLARGHRVAHAIESGMVWLNSHNVRDLRTPFGGVKESGLGREGGQHSLDFYTDQRIVHVAAGRHPRPRVRRDRTVRRHDVRDPSAQHRACRVRRAGRHRPRRQPRWFWVDMLGFVVTAEDDDALYLRGLRRG